jgi:hypothetical protein
VRANTTAAVQGVNRFRKGLPAQCPLPYRRREYPTTDLAELPAPRVHMTINQSWALRPWNLSRALDDICTLYAPVSTTQHESVRDRQHRHAGGRLRGGRELRSGFPSSGLPAAPNAVVGNLCALFVWRSCASMAEPSRPRWRRARVAYVPLALEWPCSLLKRVHSALAYSSSSCSGHRSRQTASQSDRPPGHPPNLLCAKAPSSHLLLAGSITQRGALEPSGNLPVLRPL